MGTLTGCCQKAFATWGAPCQVAFGTTSGCGAGAAFWSPQCVEHAALCTGLGCTSLSIRCNIPSSSSWKRELPCTPRCEAIEAVGGGVSQGAAMGTVASGAANA